jgi:hypothetical protein
MYYRYAIPCPHLGQRDLFESFELDTLRRFSRGTATLRSECRRAQSGVKVFPNSIFNHRTQENRGTYHGTASFIHTGEHVAKNLTHWIFHEFDSLDFLPQQQSTGSSCSGPRMKSRGTTNNSIHRFSKTVLFISCSDS